jgi:hypothetical protein
VNICWNLNYAGIQGWSLPGIECTPNAFSSKRPFDTLFREDANPNGAWEGFEGTPFINVQSIGYWAEAYGVFGTPDPGVKSMVDGNRNCVPAQQKYFVWPARNLH